MLRSGRFWFAFLFAAVLLAPGLYLTARTVYCLLTYQRAEGSAGFEARGRRGMSRYRITYSANDGKSYEQFLEGMAKGRIPIGRIGKSEEFARMACFLCSDAGSFITGVAINVDGGASPVV